MPGSDFRREGWYLAIFSFLSCAWLVGLILREVRVDEYDNLLDTVLGIGQDMEAGIVASGAITYVLVEGTAMLAERYLRRRYHEGRHEGRQEGLEEGLERGQQATLARIREGLGRSDRNGLDTVDDLIDEIKRLRDANGQSPASS